MSPIDNRSGLSHRSYQPDQVIGLSRTTLRQSENPLSTVAQQAIDQFFGNIDAIAKAGNFLPITSPDDVNTYRLTMAVQAADCALIALRQDDLSTRFQPADQFSPSSPEQKTLFKIITANSGQSTYNDYRLQQKTTIDRCLTQIPVKDFLLSNVDFNNQVAIAASAPQSIDPSCRTTDDIILVLQNNRRLYMVGLPTGRLFKDTNKSAGFVLNDRSTLEWNARYLIRQVKIENHPNSPGLPKSSTHPSHIIYDRDEWIIQNGLLFDKRFLTPNPPPRS